MKKKISLLLMAPFLALGVVSCKLGGNMKKVDVILISGQSNAVGCTHNEYISSAPTLGFEKFEEYSIGYKGIQIVYDNWTKDWPAPGQITFGSQNKVADFTAVKLGQGNGVNTFGPEIGIAERMHGKYDNKLFLIKFACGGSCLKDDWLAKNSPMYPKFINYVKMQMENLKKKGYQATIKAFCWMQGEGDSYPGYHSVYAENLATFVGNVRTELSEFTGGKELPFIDAKINPDREVWEYGPEVNAQKEQFAALSENNILIDTVEEGLHTDQEPMVPDKCHYDTESEVKLGNLFAEAFEPFLEPVK